jgi:multidrug efflux pump subunit AcrA (membrane-fusion protein)
MFRSDPLVFRVALSLALVLVATACRKPNAATAQQGPLPVNVVTTIEKEVMKWDEFIGRTGAVESVEIQPRVSG